MGQRHKLIRRAFCTSRTCADSTCCVAMAAQPLHELFDREKLIKKRFKVKGHFVDFPPTRFSGDEDGEEKKENPITTKAMEMNVTALKVMFSYYKVTSGKKVPIQKLESAATCPTNKVTCNV